ncbi:CBS domain-containing protein [Desulfoscipio gibsoniae]|uniref:Putative transcriptional regulator, contains C-terminal CBS domains n=1 Tax=Desulfoscipio gibsoniae DSM 7213 TaxID=767817 RepID=R4KBV8_9FIRM|nr:CBS domain-containing protein [Desulfoscipio gibsoniae]AGL00683.1 putative transcriptional regulator, contains C-terminal CBS domains [Desulfoscipio gibsoniae DSM 7213]
MPEKKMVKDLMLPVTEYPRIYDTDSLKDAIMALKEFMATGKKYRSLLVFSKTKKVNNEEQLVGILTVRDILNCIKNNTLSYDGPELFGMSWARFYHKDPLKKPLVTKVGDMVRPLVQAFIQSDQNVTDAIRLMITKNVNILPVFKGQRAVGIIRAVDLLDYIGDMCD